MTNPPQCVSDNHTPCISSHHVPRAAHHARQDGSDYFCATTALQRSPDDGAPLFIHRGSTKFAWTFHYTMTRAAPMPVWTHIAQHPPHCAQDPLVKQA